MPNPHISTQDWFYHMPALRSQNSPDEVPAHSQIPGLGNVPAYSSLDDDRQYKRKWIRDTDSKYVKLAKAGGRKNLLSFIPGKLSSEPVLYPRVDWFDHHEETGENGNCTNNNKKSLKGYAALPDWYVHDGTSDDKCVVGMEMNELPNEQEKSSKHGVDPLTIWQRDSQKAALKKSKDSKPLKLPRIRKKIDHDPSKKKLAVQETKNLPRLKTSVTVFDKKQDIKKLLSMDYQREWLSNKSAEFTKEMKAQLAVERDKEARMKRNNMRLRESLKPKKEVVEKKPLFKLSKFNKVKSCVDTKWSRLGPEEKSLSD